MTNSYDRKTIAHKEVSLRTITKNETVSDNNRDFMMKLLSEEYKFYEFIKKRFSLILQKAEVELPQNLTNKTVHILELQQAASHRDKKHS